MPTAAVRDRATHLNGSVHAGHVAAPPSTGPGPACYPASANSSSTSSSTASRSPRRARPALLPDSQQRKAPTSRAGPRATPVRMVTSRGGGASADEPVRQRCARYGGCPSPTTARPRRRACCRADSCRADRPGRQLLHPGPDRTSPGLCQRHRDRVPLPSGLALHRRSCRLVLL